MNAVRLCVALLGFWVVASFLLPQSPVLPHSFPTAGFSVIANNDSELLAVAVQMQDQESSPCCPDVDCSDSQACSSPCTASCPAPQVAVLENVFYRDLSSGADVTFNVVDDGFIPPLVSALFRPPIV